MSGRTRNPTHKLIRSMTGFGRARGHVRGTARRDAEVTVEVRTLNHRFLTLKARLPQNLAALEGEIESLVRERVQRGIVHLSVAVRERTAVPAVGVSRVAAQRYLADLRKLARELDLPFAPDLALITALPGVLEAPGPGDNGADGLGSRVLPLVERALVMCTKAREREGEKLRRDLIGRQRAVATILDRVRRRAPAVVAEYRQRLHRRLDELLAGRGVVLSASDLAREVAVFADRADITEEITRLKAHLDEMDHLLRGAEGLGRRLDFLLQEMNREANTIGSKAADARIAHDVVALKSDLEKMREQIQNLE